MSMPRIDKHILFTEYETVKRLCLPLNKIQIYGFIYMRFFPDGTFIDLSNQLEWTKFFLSGYLSEKYEVAPIHNHMFVNQGVTLWSAYPDNMIWQEGAQNFKFGNGISICFNKKKYKEIFCFYSDINNYSISQFYINHLDVLKKFCDYFLESMSPIIKLAEQHSNVLITPKCYLKNKINKNIIQTDPLISQFLSDIDAGYGNNTTQQTSQELTKRELECVRWVVQGKSAKQVANALYISPRTVETHLNSAKEKLNCANLKELIFLVSRNHIFNDPEFFL